jgi:hypothetical protein
MSVPNTDVNNIGAAKVEQTKEKTTITVELPADVVAPTLHTAPDTELARADRKRRLEYNDRYGEPAVPGGIMSVAQEEGEEEIPTPAGGRTSIAGALNLAAEQTRLEKRQKDVEQARLDAAPQEIKDRQKDDSEK